MKAYIKLFFEVIPLVVFFLVNSHEKTIIEKIPLEGIFQATFYFIIVSIIVIPFAWYIDKKIPWMPIVTGAFLIIFGSLTIFLKDDFFIKFKPTLINLIFASILLIGLKFNKLFLKMAMSKAFVLQEKTWKTLTLRWSMFFILLALINEIVWRTQSTEFWVSFKVFGILPLTLVFALLQLPLITRDSGNKK
ncbi:MAG: septation protein A [Rickettsiales bacterium]|nr:septation protein A [Rickettsiales bacterium]OUV79470.1 MAG: septation protein A [Rickettsiales bacterium TMED131]